MTTSNVVRNDGAMLKDRQNNDNVQSPRLAVSKAETSNFNQDGWKIQHSNVEKANTVMLKDRQRNVKD